MREWAHRAVQPIRGLVCGLWRSLGMIVDESVRVEARDDK
jgi:hypothetical protein